MPISYDAMCSGYRRCWSALRGAVPILVCLLGLLAGAAFQPASAEPALVCATPPPASGKSRQRFDATALMTVAGLLESQGEADFHIKFDAPSNECLVEVFRVGEVAVDAFYSPFQQGDSTLLYRFAVDGAPAQGAILVVYSGFAAQVAKRGAVFHVSQEKDGVISWYAMYREYPAYSDVRLLVSEILAGRSAPLMAVRWPKGAKEGELVAFDSKRLK